MGGLDKRFRGEMGPLFFRAEGFKVLIFGGEISWGMLFTTRGVKRVYWEVFNMLV